MQADHGHASAQQTLTARGDLGYTDEAPAPYPIVSRTGAANTQPLPHRISPTLTVLVRKIAALPQTTLVPRTKHATIPAYDQRAQHTDTRRLPLFTIADCPLPIASPKVQRPALGPARPQPRGRRHRQRPRHHPRSAHPGPRVRPIRGRPRPRLPHQRRPPTLPRPRVPNHRQSPPAHPAPRTPHHRHRPGIPTQGRLHTPTHQPRLPRACGGGVREADGGGLRAFPTPWGRWHAHVSQIRLWRNGGGLPSSQSARREELVRLRHNGEDLFSPPS